MMQVLLKIGHGKIYLPHHIPSELYKGSYPYSRMGEIVEIIKEEGKKHQIRIFDIRMENMEEDIIYNESGTPYYHIKMPGSNRIETFEIQQVKQGVPWKIICSKKFGETIHYKTNKDKTKIKIKELNYCE